MAASLLDCLPYELIIKVSNFVALPRGKTPLSREQHQSQGPGE